MILTLFLLQNEDDDSVVVSMIECRFRLIFFNSWLLVKLSWIIWTSENLCFSHDCQRRHCNLCRLNCLSSTEVVLKSLPSIETLIAQCHRHLENILICTNVVLSKMVLHLVAWSSSSLGFLLTSMSSSFHLIIIILNDRHGNKEGKINCPKVFLMSSCRSVCCCSCCRRTQNHSVFLLLLLPALSSHKKSLKRMEML